LLALNSGDKQVTSAHLQRSLDSFDEHIAFQQEEMKVNSGITLENIAKVIANVAADEVAQYLDKTLKACAWK
jgi:6-pyruvoyl-tetrahydropterin synthase